MTSDTGKQLRELVEQQILDEGLWFDAETAPEAYLQQELRKLHAHVEARVDLDVKYGGVIAAARKVAEYEVTPLTKMDECMHCGQDINGHADDCDWKVFVDALAAMELADA